MIFEKESLGDVCKISSSKRIFAREYKSEGIPFYRGKEIIEKHNGNDISSELYISRERYEEIKAKYDVPKIGDILLTSVGTLGIPWLVSEENFYFKDGNLTWLRSTEKLIPHFLYWWLNSQEAKNQIDSMCIGSTQKALTIETLKKFKISLPNIEYQKKVIAILQSLQDKIETNTAINKNLEEQARTLYKAWFVDFEPFGGERPSNWSTGSLKDVLTLKRNAIKAGENTVLPYLPIDIIPMNTFALSDVKPNNEAKSSLITFDKDDILIGAMRVYFHRVVIAPFDGITRTTCFVLSPIENEYLSYGLLCCDQDSSIEYAQTTSKGSTMPYAVWDGGLADMEITIPDKETARKFNEAVLPMIRMIQLSYDTNLRLRELRNTLLPMLMSGELDISDIDI